MNELIELDKKLFLFLNGYHFDWLDPIMYWATDKMTWLPLYVLLMYFIVKDYRNETWIVLISMTIAIVLADQFTSTLMKPYFARLRPSHDPTLSGLVHIVNGYKGGKFGFASSHAADTFGTATFLWLLFSKRRKWITVMFLWAALMAYSRIYLGVHYPADILVGAFFGVLAGIAGYRIFIWLKNAVDNRKTNPSDGT